MLCGAEARATAIGCISISDPAADLQISPTTASAAFVGEAETDGGIGGGIRGKTSMEIKALCRVASCVLCGVFLEMTCDRVCGIWR